MDLKQDKGRDIVVIDRKKYTEKSISLLHIDSFIQLDHDPTKTTKGKSQRSVRKIKNNLINKNTIGFTQQGHHLENFMA